MFQFFGSIEYLMKVEELCKSVSVESPCGKDLEHDPDFMQLQTDLEPPQERMMGAAMTKEPNWREIAARSEALFSRTKDLRVAVWLTRAWTHRDGLIGLMSGLHLINDLITLYWKDMHPRSAEDENDFEMKLNKLSEIGNYEILVRDVQSIVLVFQHDKMTIRDILIVLGKIPVSNHPSGYTQAQIVAMFHDQENGTAIKNLRDGLTEALETLLEIQKFLKQPVNGEQLPDFKKLTATLEPILNLCKSDNKLNQEVGEKSSSPTGAAVEKTTTTPGEIRNREDIARILESVCQYIERTEPTNPVSLIIRFAQTLMTKNFLEIIEALPPEDMKVFKRIIDADKKVNVDKGK